MELQVEQFLKKKGLLEKGDNILIAVSGGLDSMALLHFLSKRQAQFQISISVVTIDHQLRGEESYLDMMFVKSYCEKHNIPCFGIQIDVNETIRKTGLSTEMAARKERYQAYESVFLTGAFSKLVLAHHADDQIETVLMQLTRGTNHIGSIGIPYKRPFLHGSIIRPFLAVTKSEIQSYVHKYEIPFHEDPSNESSIYTRNRFRKTVLPFLKEENQKVHEKFQQFVELLSMENEVLVNVSEQSLNHVIKSRTKDSVSITISRFVALRKSLQRRVIQLILNYLYKELSEVISNSHIEAILTLVQGNNPNSQINLPLGITVLRSYEVVIFTFSKNEEVKEQCLALQANERILLWNETSVKCSLMYGHDLLKKEIQSFQFYCPVSKVKLPLLVRTRKQGDRISQKGTGGTKKLKSLFIDQKVPIDERQLWPIVSDSNDQILWVPLLKKGNLEGTIQLDELYLFLEYKQQVTN